MTAIRQLTNQALDALVRPKIRLGRRQIPAYQFFGGLGWALAISWAVVLTVLQGLHLWVIAVLCLGTAASLLGLAIAVKVLTGRERLVNYAHQFSALTVAAILLWAIGQPVLPYLDVVAVGLGLFLAVGRVGCLMSGCCHGKPHAWGVCYQPNRGHDGSSPHLTGVRLLPVQVLSSLWLVFTSAVGSVLILTDALSGFALGWYVTAYASGRFALEFLRGDAGRTHSGGLSAAQWTSVIVVAGAFCAGLWQVLPGFPVHSAALAVVLAGATLTFLHRQRSGKLAYRLLHPDHLPELAGLLSWANQHDVDEIRSARTSRGLQLSASSTAFESETIRHYALSCHETSPNWRTMHRLAETICCLAQAPGQAEIAVSNRGVIHLLIHEPMGGDAE